tara:strand:- start:45 stop:239 length:195 start_codon:yes stop_codon:yes gene_type:complete
MNIQEIVESAKRDENLLKAYSSRNCKECYGRGYIELKPPGEELQKVICSCFIKNLKKEFNDGNQ